MQKPPPDQETILRNLVQFRDNYSRNSLDDIEFLDDAIKALDKPQTVKQLAEALEIQSTIVDACGWPGIASNMRTAAKKLIWHITRAVDWREGLCVENEKDLGKALVQFIENHRDKLENYQIDLIGRVSRDLADKPKTEDEPNEFDKKPFSTCLANARNSVEYVAKNGITDNTKSALIGAVQHLRAAIKKLDIRVRELEIAKIVVDG